MTPPYTIVKGDSPLVAAAIHNGHAVRDEVAARLALSERERLREEDPFTGEWTRVAATRIVGQRSRFEVDLNRPREGAVYREPADAWGLTVWRERPSEALVVRSLEIHDAFYREVEEVLTELTARFGCVVVFDLHTYNHRREGPRGPLADPDANPEVNVGTGSLDRERWDGVVERFMTDLSAFDFAGRRLDVRENVKFRGGEFPRWVHRTFPDTACALAIEFKKFFMDEWTGEENRERLELIHRALAATVPGVLEELERR